MKLRNKKTGEIMEFDAILPVKDVKGGSVAHLEYGSLAELNAEWEGYEEPKEYWFLSGVGEIVYMKDDGSKFDKDHKFIGNYFETREEAEKAVEKLKAITRLNKCGFKFEGYDDRDRANGGDIVIYAHINIPNNNLLEEAQPAMLKDLDLLFGGEK
jgi:hypothetical protein